MSLARILSPRVGHVLTASIVFIVSVTVTTACSFEAPAQVSRDCSTFVASGTRPELVDPKLTAETTRLCFQAFAVLHSGITRTPLYVAEHLTRTSVERARELDTRDNRFHPEPRLSFSERAELADYRGSGYDRGHMAPSGDMGDPADDFESFSLANIVPQEGRLNRNGWAELEGYVRDLAGTLGEAYVVTGPAFVGESIERLGGRVLVPTHIWKAVFVPGQGAGAWIVTNDDRQHLDVVSISTLAQRIGLDPFPSLDSTTKSKTPRFPVFDDRSDAAGDQ